MGLLSFFKRNVDTPAAEPPAGTDAVAHARTRARRRLIGATVLLGVGVIGFPLLFETQPRPIPVDIPIEIPRKEAAAPLALPPPRPATASTATDGPPPTAASHPRPAASAARAVEPAAPVITERAAEQGREVAPMPTAAASAPAAIAARAASAAAARVAAASAPSASPARTANDGQRAQALLEGKPVAPKASDVVAARLVVQVGAYTDADKLREARQKVEKLGMKTYTQVVEVEGAKRTRVRVGPFTTREEADKAAARIKAAGLPVAVLTL